MDPSEVMAKLYRNLEGTLPWRRMECHQNPLGLHRGIRLVRKRLLKEYSRNRLARPRRWRRATSSSLLKERCYPNELLAMAFKSMAAMDACSHLGDAELRGISSQDLGGHDMAQESMQHTLLPRHVLTKANQSVALARTIKGYGLGPAFAGRNTTHQRKKADENDLRLIRDAMGLEFTDEQLEKLPFIRPEDVPEVVAYAKNRRIAMGGPCPERRSPKFGLTLPEDSVYADFDEGTKGKSKFPLRWSLFD